MAARCSRDMAVWRNIDEVVMQIRREIAEACSKATDENSKPPLNEREADHAETNCVAHQIETMLEPGAA